MQESLRTSQDQFSSKSAYLPVKFHYDCPLPILRIFCENVAFFVKSKVWNKGCNERIRISKGMDIDKVPINSRLSIPLFKL